MRRKFRPPPHYLSRNKRIQALHAAVDSKVCRYFMSPSAAPLRNLRIRHRLPYGIPGIPPRLVHWKHSPRFYSVSRAALQATCKPPPVLGSLASTNPRLTVLSSEITALPCLCHPLPVTKQAAEPPRRTQRNNPHD